MSTVSRVEFDARIGRLDRCLSEFLDLLDPAIDEPDRQTLKHHADDLIGVGTAMLDRLKPVEPGRRIQPQHGANCSINMPMDRTCDCGVRRNHD